MSELVVKMVVIPVSELSSLIKELVKDELNQCNSCSKWHTTSIPKEISQKLKDEMFQPVSDELKQLRESVQKHSPKEDGRKNNEVIAAAYLHSTGKISFYGRAKGFLYENAEGETKFVMKES